MSSISNRLRRVPSEWYRVDAPSRGHGVSFDVTRTWPFDFLTERLTIHYSLFADNYGDIRSGRHAARSVPLSGEPDIDSSTIDADFSPDIDSSAIDSAEN